MLHGVSVKTCTEVTEIFIFVGLLHHFHRLHTPYYSHLNQVLNKILAFVSQIS